MCNTVTAAAKYAVMEFERRWLVDPAAVRLLDGQPYREIEDTYIAGTRLRLRKIVSADGGIVFKFCKKYGKSSPLSEPITNLYLAEVEYRLLAQLLQGPVVRKRRYAIAGGAIDIYSEPAIEVIIFEVEFQSEAEAERYVPPAFARQEVTSDPAYSGAVLAGA